MTCACVPDACTAAAGTATLARIDPLAPSARIAEMMMFRPTRMTPPWLLPRSAARCMAPATRTAHLNNVGLLPVYGNSTRPNGNSSNTGSQIQIVVLIIDVNNVSELSTERCCATCTVRGAAGTDDISGGG